ncbi:MAG: ABC transporter substrate-binding protein, partial [Pseudomonadota bacterium]
MKHLILSILIGALSLTAQAEEMRLVTLGVMPAETVVALNATEQLVAIDRSAASLAAQLPAAQMLNYHRNTSSEGVLSMKPTHVIVTSAAGPPPAIEQIRATGVKFLKVAEPTEWKDVIAGVDELGGFIQRTAEAEALIATLQEQKSSADAWVE